MNFIVNKKNLLVLMVLIVPILSGLIFYLFLNIPEVKANTAATTSLSIVITVCGNSIIEGSEQCDGSNNLGEQTCVGLGFAIGDLGCKGDCTFDTSGCNTRLPSLESLPWWLLPQKEETKVILQGKAYPESSITLLIDGKIAKVVKADSRANFKIELVNLNSGVYNFGLWAQDNEGKKSATFSFNVTVSSGLTTDIGGIFIPSTIKLGKPNLEKGEVLNISGQSAPQSEIIIYIQPAEEEKIIEKNIKTDEKGNWIYLFNTLELEKEGPYYVKVKAVSLEGLMSNFSTVLDFFLGRKIPVEELCPNADLNKDGKTDLIDFSILLYWWGKFNLYADQNKDGTVNLYDFSIMMYYWTG